MACHRLWESLPKQPQSCGLKIRIGYEASTCMRAFTHNQPHQLTAAHWKLAGTLPYAASPLRSCASSEHIHPTLAEERKGTVCYATALVVMVTSYTHTCRTIRKGCPNRKVELAVEWCSGITCGGQFITLLYRSMRVQLRILFMHQNEVSI